MTSAETTVCFIIITCMYCDDLHTIYGSCDVLFLELPYSVFLLQFFVFLFIIFATLLAVGIYVYVKVDVSTCVVLLSKSQHTHTHTHIYIYTHNSYWSVHKKFSNFLTSSQNIDSYPKNVKDSTSHQPLHSLCIGIV